MPEIQPGIANLSVNETITNNNVINTGNGDDLLSGFATDTNDEAEANGIINNGVIDTGNKNDTLEGTAIANGIQAAEANGILNQGPTGTILTGNGDDVLRGTAEATAINPGGEIFIASSNGVINDSDGLIDLGNGRDLITATASTIFDGVVDPDDAETFSDALENSGQIFTGKGDDTIEVEAFVKAKGAVGIAGGLDNSSVGNPNANTVLDMGAGRDRIKAFGESTSVGDVAIASGIDTRSVLDMGAGDDIIETRGVASAVREGNPTQEIVFADGLENRAQVNLGKGNDQVMASATATGTGFQRTIADGIDNRGTFEAGAGNDQIEASGEAFGKEGSFAIGIGLLNENGDAGRLLFDKGRDQLIGTGFASGEDSDAQAIGISNVSINIPAAGLSVIDMGTGEDLIQGEAEATGNQDVRAFGTFGGVFETGNGADQMVGRATAKDGRLAIATGVNNSDNDGALISMGNGSDLITASAHARAKGDTAIANGIENQNLIELGDGGDRVEANAKSLSRKAGIEGGVQTESIAAALDNTGSFLTGDGSDQLSLSATAEARGRGFSAFAHGVNNSGRVETGNGTDEITASAIAIAAKSNSEAIGILNESQGLAGTIETGDGADLIVGTASAEVTEQGNAIAIGISNGESGVINTGDGNDIVRGEATGSSHDGTVETFGIFGGTINTGDGSDQVIASSFGGNVNVNTGRGQDLIAGFGEAIVDGGDGIDVLAFDFTLEEFFTQGGSITPGDAATNELTFSLDGVDMVVRNVEDFTFAGEPLSLGVV